MTEDPSPVDLNQYSLSWLLDGPSLDLVRLTGEPLHQFLEKIHAAHASHARLESLHDAMRTSCSNDISSPDNAGLMQMLDSQVEATAKLKGFLDACVELYPTSMRPTKQSHVVAKQVFSTPELIEAILLHLRPPNLLKAMQINKDVFRIFQESPALLDRLQLRVRKGAFMSNTILDHFPGLHVLVDRGNCDMDYIMQDLGLGDPFGSLGLSPTNLTGPLKVIARIDRTAPLAIGSRCRSMFVVYPVVLCMRVAMSCCTRWERDNGNNNSTTTIADPAVPRDEEQEKAWNLKVNESRVIRSHIGVTIGHLYDAVELMREAHRNCPKAPESEHNEDGEVVPEISFSAKLDLKSHDPYLFELEDKYVPCQLKRLPKKNQAARKKRLGKLYVQAKQRAHANKWSVLSFADWKSKYDINSAQKMAKQPVVINLPGPMDVGPLELSDSDDP